MSVPSSDALLRGLKILVVEDEYLLADEMHRALFSAGAHVLGPVRDEKSALDLLESEACDCAILDINLNGKQCFRLANEAVTRGIPAAFTTGYNVEVVPPEFQAFELFEKPFDISDVIDFIVAATGRSR
ncbi:MAG TPA: response regulator [Rhizobiaceae bacterium]|nr:response regulator [Rhizobiaceae bacterium]